VANIRIGKNLIKLLLLTFLLTLGIAMFGKPIDVHAEEYSVEAVSGEGSIAADSLNFRSGPGKDYDSLGTVRSGTTVAITGEADGWYQIEYDGKTGFVSAQYVKLDGELTKAEAEDESDKGDAISGKEDKKDDTLDDYGEPEEGSFVSRYKMLLVIPVVVVILGIVVSIVLTLRKNDEDDYDDYDDDYDDRYDDYDDDGYYDDGYDDEPYDDDGYDDDRYDDDGYDDDHYDDEGYDDEPYDDDGYDDDHYHDDGYDDDYDKHYDERQRSAKRDKRRKPSSRDYDDEYKDEYDDEYYDDRKADAVRESKDRDLTSRGTSQVRKETWRFAGKADADEREAARTRKGRRDETPKTPQKTEMVIREEDYKVNIDPKFFDTQTIIEQPDMVTGYIPGQMDREEKISLVESEISRLQEEVDKLKQESETAKAEAKEDI